MFSGAGISAESGVPTFRDDETGLWAKYDPYEISSTDGWRKHPERVWAWYLWRHHAARRFNLFTIVFFELGYKIRHDAPLTAHEFRTESVKRNAIQVAFLDSIGAGAKQLAIQIGIVIGKERDCDTAGHVRHAE